MNKFFLNDNNMLMIVLLNTIIIFICRYFPDNTTLYDIDNVFTYIFLVEAIIKIYSLSWTEYWEKAWNKFDFIILLIALPSLLSDDIPTNILLILRSFRLVKSLKLIKFIPHVNELIKGLKQAFKSSFIVCIAFILFLFNVAIFTNVIYENIAPEYFGNPGISIYNIFRLFTIEGWYEIPNNIESHTSNTIAVFTKIYFSILLFIGGILGMSIINSIFVDAMAIDNNDDIKQQLDKIEKQLESLTKKLNKN